MGDNQPELRHAKGQDARNEPATPIDDHLGAPRWHVQAAGQSGVSSAGEAPAICHRKG